MTSFVFTGVRIDKALRDVTTFIRSAVPPKKPMSPQHTPDIVNSHLVAGETRLAPLKAMSIPRLELIGELMDFTMKRQICSALQVPMNKGTFWVDSANVGLWIQGQSRKYKPSFYIIYAGVESTLVGHFVVEQGAEMSFKF